MQPVYPKKGLDTSKPRIAVIGLGNFGRKILKKMDTHAITIALSAKNIDQEKIEIAKKYSAVFCQDIVKIINMQPNIVFVATPPNTHYKIAKTLLSYHTAIFLEKPPASTQRETNELIALSKKINTPLYIDDVFRHRKEWQVIKKTLKGPIKNITYFWSCPGNSKDHLLDSLVYHDMYLLVDLLGTHNIKNVNIITSKQKALEFRFIYGEVNIHGSYVSGDTEKRKSVEIICDDKKLVWDNENLTLPNGILSSYNKQDPLLQILLGTLNTSTDYTYNNSLASNTMNIIDTIRNTISK